MADDFANAAPARSVSGEAWRADQRDSATVTLTAPLRRPAAGGRATFMLWYDTEPGYERVLVDTSADGGLTWSPAELTLRDGGRRWTAPGMVTGYGGRQWWNASVDLPAGTTHLRWRSSTDGSSRGRGVYLDKIHAVDPDGVLFNGNGNGPDAGPLLVDGWSVSAT